MVVPTFFYVSSMHIYSTERVGKVLGECDNKKEEAILAVKMYRLER